MTPSENLPISTRLFHSEQTQSIVPPQIEPIDQQPQSTELTDRSSTYLLTNLYDPEVAALRKEANKEIVDGWTAAQTTHRTTENHSIKKGIDLLNERYANVEKPTIDDIKDYINNNKNNFTAEEFTFLENYLNKANGLFNGKDRDLLQLCWLALSDENAICHNCDLDQLPPPAMCTKRKQLFLQGLTQRLMANSICGHGSYNAIYEAMQCLHPDTKRIMDLAAIHELITLTVQQVLVDYLLAHPTLSEQLKIIKLWLDNTADGQSIFAQQEEHLQQQLMDKICDQFIKKGYEVSVKAISMVQKQFYGTPLFLRDFENLEIEFPQEIYQIQSGIHGLEDHIKSFKRRSLTKKYREYRDYLPQHLFESLIEKLLIEKIDTHTPQLTRRVLGYIVDQLKNHSDILDGLLCKIISDSRENQDVRFSAMIIHLSKMLSIKRSPDEIIKVMSHLCSAEELMWLLCHSYHKEKLEIMRESLGNLILFLHKLGVNPENCIYLNISAAKLLMTTTNSPKPEILNTIPSIRQQKHISEQIESDFINSSVYRFGSYFFMIIYIVGSVYFTASVVPILTLMVMNLPLVLRNELLDIRSYFTKIKTFILQTNNFISLTSDQKKLYKEFFTPSQNSIDKIFSPFIKITNIFNTTHTAYSPKLFNPQGYYQDLLQPMFGIKHIVKGFFKIVTAPICIFDSRSSLSAIPIQAANGLSTMIRGLAEIISTPYTYFFKIPYRTVLTIFPEEYQQRKMLSLALDLQKEITDSSKQDETEVETNNQPISINTPLLDKTNDSSKKIYNQFFNQASNIHKEYKQFKRSLSTKKSQFQAEEKVKWKEVKSVFFKQMTHKKADMQEAAEKALSDYCRLFTT